MYWLTGVSLHFENSLWRNPMSINPFSRTSQILLGALIPALFLSHAAISSTAKTKDDVAVSSGAADSALVLRVVDSFHRALAAADSSTVLRLLAEDVTVLESGGVESRSEYRSHHLAADIAFSQAVPSQPGPRNVTIQGEAAWVSSTSVMEGEYRSRQVNSVSAELMVLSRTATGWVIRAIHWSSRSRNR
jgi:ketosteroid isomerase-like protein